MSNLYNDEQDDYLMAAPEVEGPKEHLKEDDLYGVKTITFVASITASMEDLQNHKHKAVWTLPPEAHKFLQTVTTDVNRTNASKEHLTGDPSRSVVVGATIKAVRNEFPKDIGLNLKGLVPRELTGNGAHNYVIFANQAPEHVDVSIFEPDSLFDEEKYVKYSKLTPEALKSQIVFSEHDKTHCDVYLGTLAYDLLIKNARLGAYDDAATNQLAEMHSAVAGNDFLRKIQVPIEIGKELFDAVKAPLDQIEKSFTDLRNTSVRFAPVDGQAWNAFTTLVGDAVGQDSSDARALNDYELTTVRRCSAKIEFKYVSFGTH